MSRCRARPTSSSWLFLLVVLADSSWDSPSAPRLLPRLTCWFMANHALGNTWVKAARRRTRWRSAGLASAAEVADETRAELRYCPTESRFKPKQASEKHQGEKQPCDRLLVEVQNSSGGAINVFRMDSESQEVFELALDQDQVGTIPACRGQLWRARASSSGAPGRRRLLSEIRVPPALPLPNDAGADDADQPENSPGNTLLWGVLSCVGFPLPQSFGVSSSLGGLGHLQLSREKKATVRPTADIEGLVSLTLEEAFRGKDVSVTVQRRVLCPVCNGFGASSFVSCDRCGGSGQLLHDAHLSNGEGAPINDSCRRPFHGMGTATTERRRNNSSGAHVESHCTGFTGCTGGGSTSGLGQADDNNHSTFNNRGHETFRQAKVSPDGADVEGDANDGSLKLSHSRDCANCKGTGKIPAPRNEEESGYCTRCAGAGFVVSATELVLSIPAGVEMGQTEVYKGKGHVDLADLIDSLLQSAADEQEARAGGETGGKGNTAPDAAPAPPASSMAPDALPSASSKAFFAPPRRHEKVKTGNFRLTVDVLPHPVFSRGDGGADLYTSVAISLEEALVGFTRKITAIDETVVVLRRTSRTLPGMVLRFPGLGMPIPVPSGRKRPSACAGNTKSASPSVEPASTVAEANAIVDTLRATTGAVAGQDQEEECDVGASGGETAAFGDLFVEVSVTLPAGMRDDRSKLIGTFLKAGSDEAREEEEGEREGIEGDKSGGWRGTRRGSKRRQKRTKPEEVAQETV